MFANCGVLDPAIREVESLRQVTSPTYFRIRETLWVGGCVVGHGRGVSSKLRRPGWMQRRLFLNRNTYSQVCGPSTWHSENGKQSPRFTARHFSGSGSFCSLIVSSVTDSPRRIPHQSCRTVENQLKPLVQKGFPKIPIKPKS